MAFIFTHCDAGWDEFMCARLGLYNTVLNFKGGLYNRMLYLIHKKNI